jgi:hypothetical protein
MRPAIVLPLLGLAACGARSSTVVGEPAGVPGVIYQTPTSAEIRIASDDRAANIRVALPPDSAFSAALTVYRTLGAPLRTQDRARGAIASEPFAAPRELLGRRIGVWIDCGTTMTGPRVDRWAVTLELGTAVAPAEGGTRVASLLTGFARPRDGSSSDPVRCASTGLLEREIARLIGGDPG